ncbi:hypothetical protein [uncultured Helicobacter sp.]
MNLRSLRCANIHCVFGKVIESLSVSASGTPFGNGTDSINPTRFYIFFRA